MEYIENTITVDIKRRSISGRIKKLPKFLKKNWEFTKQAKFSERICFCYTAVKILFS